MPYLTDPASSHVAVTPHDSTNFTRGVCRSLYIGVTGDVVAVVDGTALTYKNAVQGSVLPVMATRVNSTGTTAQNIIALY